MESMMHLIIEYRYWILLPLSFAEGPIVAFVAGALASLGYFNIWVLAVFFLARDLGVDLACYYLGRYGGQTSLAHKALRTIGVTKEDLGKVRHLWDKHPGKTMFFSKLSYGLAAGFIVVAGIVEMPVSLFFRYGVFVAVAHYGTLLFLGFYFGNSFGTISKILENVQYAIAGVALFIIAYYIFKRFVSSRLRAEREEEERISEES